MRRLYAVTLPAALGASLALGPSTVLADRSFTGFAKPFTATETTASGETAVIAGQGAMTRAKGAGHSGYVLSDLKNSKAYLVFDSWKAYYEAQRDADQGGDMEARLDPCREQKKIAKEAPGVTCTKAGTVMLNGRKADKYVTRMQGSDEALTTYFDPQLRLVVKQDGGEEDFEMKNIKVGSAPGPFALPAG
ncbi:MAG: hypothetical protein ACREH3_18790, partial [Geminicoccales bacterium]